MLASTTKKPFYDGTPDYDLKVVATREDLTDSEEEDDFERATDFRSTFS